MNKKEKTELTGQISGMIGKMLKGKREKSKNQTILKDKENSMSK